MSSGTVAAGCGAAVAGAGVAAGGGCAAGVSVGCETARETGRAAPGRGACDPGPTPVADAFAPLTAA